MSAVIADNTARARNRPENRAHARRTDIAGTLASWWTDSRRVMCFVAGTMLALGGSEVRAQASLPPLNLGDSSFQDGIAGPGWLVQHTLSAHRTDHFRDEDGARVDPPSELAATALLAQVSYLSERKLFGAYWGAEIIVPVAELRMTSGAGAEAQTHGIGDVFVSPLLLQWPKTSLLGRPFWQRLNLNVTVPTGRYRRDAPLNPGSNAWSVNPHYAFTWEVSPDWEVSGRLHYLWVAANDDPPTVTGAHRTQPGQAVHLNASVSRAAGERLRLGASAYFLTQITDDRIDSGQRAGRERVFAAGPALSWRLGRTTLYAAAYRETWARDRPQGFRLSLRYAATF